MNKCPKCGNNCEGVACWRHKPKKPIPRSRNREPREKESKRVDSQQIHEMFLEICEERKDGKGYLYCYETGEKIPKYLYDSTTIYHHLLEKEPSKFPQFALCKWNIYTVLPEIHELTHNDRDRTPRLRDERERLIEKYVHT